MLVISSGVAHRPHRQEWRGHPGRVTGPKQHRQRYLAPRDLGLQKVSAEDVDGELRSVSIARALRGLAWLLHRTDLAGNDRVALEDIAGRMPIPWGDRALHCLQDPSYVLLGAQPLLHLVLRALDVCPDEDPHGRPDTELPTDQLTVLAVAAVDALPQSDTGPELTTLRSALLTASQGEWRLWLEETPALLPHVLARCATTEFADFSFESTFRTATGLTFEQLVLGSCLLAGVQDLEDDWPYADLTEAAPPHQREALRAVAACYRTPLGALRAAARADLASGSAWSFRSLYMTPAVEIPGQEPLVIRPSWLRDRAASSSIVNVIGDVLRNQDSKLSGQWQTLLGKAHEDRGHKLLESLPARADRRVYREDGPDGGLKLLLGAGKCCDALLVEGTTWIAIDFVRHAFTARTVVDGTLEDLQRDLKRAIVQKVRQCDETLRRAVDHPDLMKTHGRPRRIYNLIVNGADMPLDPVLHKQIREAISNAQSSTFVDSHPKGLSPLVTDIASFSALIGIGTTGARPSKILADWRASQYSDWSLFNFLAVHRQTQLLRRRERGQWFARAADFFQVEV